MFLEYILLNSGAECDSDDNWLGEFTTIQECANVCRKTECCNFFLYGTGEKDGQCYWEKTENKNCPEDWEEDSFNFYEIKRKFSSYTYYK